MISITDGQIFLQSDLFFSGVRPAVNVGTSVSRVGSSAQTKAMKKVAGRLRLDLAQYRELEAFAQFGSELDQATQSALNRGEKMVATLNQPQYQPWPIEEQVAALYAGVNGHLDDIPTADIPRFHDELREHLRTEKSIYAHDPREGDLSDETSEKLNAELEKVKGRFAAVRAAEPLIGLDAGSEAARPLDHEHPQGDARDGARRLGAAAPRADAHRGDASLRRPHAGADGGRVAGGRVGAAPTARAAPGGEDRGDRRGHRRPRPRRRLQRASDPALARPPARGPGGRPGRRLVLDGTQSRIDAPLPSHERRAVLDRFQRAARRTATPRRSRTPSPTRTSSSEVDKVSSSTTRSSRRSPRR